MRRFIGEPRRHGTYAVRIRTGTGWWWQICDGGAALRYTRSTILAQEALARIRADGRPDEIGIGSL